MHPRYHAVPDLSAVERARRHERRGSRLSRLSGRILVAGRTGGSGSQLRTGGGRRRMERHDTVTVTGGAAAHDGFNGSRGVARGFSPPPPKRYYVYHEVYGKSYAKK